MKITAEINLKNVSNILKCIVNQLCDPDSPWFPETEKDRGATLLELLYAIRILEAQKEGKITITDKEEETE